MLLPLPPQQGVSGSDMDKGAIRTHEPAEDALGAKECETKGDTGQGSVSAVIPTGQRQKSTRLVTYFDYFLVKFDSANCVFSNKSEDLTVCLTISLVALNA